ncbi:fumarylacetoacetate hydrolase family protein [Microbacterium sp. P5_E9]
MLEAKDNAMTDHDAPPVSTDAFGVGTFVDSDGAFPGVVRDNTVYDARPVVGRDATLRDLLSDWDACLDSLAEFVSTQPQGRSIADVEILPPVQPVGQILCAGANYRRHVQQIVVSTFRNSGDLRSDEELRDLALQTVERQTHSDPFMFVGLPSAVSGARDDIVLWSPGEQHDWEIELGVILQHSIHRVSPEDAMSHVAGYVMSNDLTVRDVMSRPGMPLTDFLTSKNGPTYFPTGPIILPARFVQDYRRLQLTLRVNGEIMQDESVSDIIRGVEACVSYASHRACLSVGDMILTGSPAGNAGHHGNRWLRPGDVIEATITGLGTQTNRCVAPSR